MTRAARPERLCNRPGCTTMVQPPRRYCSKDCVLACPPRGVSKQCVECGIELPRGRRSHTTCSEPCAIARRAKTIASQSLSSEETRARRRESNRSKYKGRDKATLTQRLTEAQGGKCKVCGGTGKRRGDGRTGLVLDHDHATGKPRAMLCSPCNVALGLLAESPARIAGLLAYVESWATAEDEASDG